MVTGCPLRYESSTASYRTFESFEGGETTFDIAASTIEDLVPSLPLNH